MYNVSEAYKEQMRNDVRNFSHMQIKFGITDPDAQRYGYVNNTSARLSYSSVPDLTFEQSVSARYGTLEPGFWLLDGSKKTYATNADWQGFVSTNLSDDEGDFNSPPSISIKFTNSSYYRFYGLTFKFDEICNEWPETVTIKSYLSGSLVDSFDVEIKGSEYVIEHGVPTTDETYLDQLVLEFSKNRIPRRRARLTSILMGVYKTLDAESIIDAEWKRSNDLMNTTAPIDEFTFTFYDEDRFYDPENPTGIWSYLDVGQEITTNIGYELEDGTIEWVPAGVHYTDGAPSVDDSGVLSKVTFNAVSKLENLTDIYDEGEYSASGTTLYTLAVRLMQFMDLSSADYVLSTQLQNYTSKAALPVLPVKDLLQLIANAGMCVMYVNRNDQIVIEPRNSSTDPFVYDNDSVYDGQPNLNKYPVLKSITTGMHNYSRGTERETLAEIDVTGASNTLYTIEYECSSIPAVTVTSGLTINSYKLLGSYRTKVVVTGTGTLTVTGYKIEDQAYSITKDYNVKGESSVIDNPLITDETHCATFNQWIADVLSRRNQYEFSERGFPEVDMGDNIHIDTAYISEGVATIVSNNIKYNGALKATTEVLGI